MAGYADRGTLNDAGAVPQNDFFSSMGQALGYGLGAVVGTAASALPTWTAYQLQKQSGNQLANPTYDYRFSDPRLSTPLYTTQPLQWTGQAGAPAVTIDQQGNIIPAGYSPQQIAGPQQDFTPILLIGAAALALLLVLR